MNKNVRRLTQDMECHYSSKEVLRSVKLELDIVFSEEYREFML